MDSNKQAEASFYSEITENIKSGAYFKDALDWYGMKYLHPVTQRSFLVFITMSSVITAIAAIIILFRVLPLVNVVPIAVGLDGMDKYYANLRYIGTPAGPNAEDPNESLIKYLVMNYIKTREDYEFSNLRNDLDFVNKFSTDEVYEEYKNFVRPEVNINSPVLKYREDIVREIEVLRVVKVKRGEGTEIAPGQHRLVATFRAEEIGPGAGGVSIWRAKIEANLSDVVFYRDTVKFSPLDFEVVRYTTEQLE